MSPVPAKLEWQRALTTLAGLAVFVVVVIALYWARSIFIPVALAIFLAFVMSPVVHWLHRRGLGRLPAVLTTVAGGVAIFLLVGWLVVSQMVELADSLPNYTENIKRKVETVREWVMGDGESRWGRMLDEISAAITQSPTAPKPGAAPRVLAPEVAVPSTTAAGAVGGAAATGGVIATATPRLPAVPLTPEDSPSPSWLGNLGTYASPVLELVGQFAFAFILSVFMLLKKEDLRNRIIRLTGDTRVTTTTKATDDASRRISRYLFMQLVINSTFGVIITVVLLAIGVRYALLWGFLASVMRYIPYVGTYLGLIPPLVFTLALSDGWWQPITVVAVYAGLEITCNNVFEPWLYGTSMGLSEVAQLVAAAFWAFLWGPIGLILSGPLTVCLLVLGKYVPRFEFFEVLLGDEPALSPDVRLYQRLTAHDQDEATDIAREALKHTSAEQVFDTVLIPALTYVKRDGDLGEVSREERHAILGSMHEITDDIIEHRLIPEGGSGDDEPGALKVRVLCVPGRDEADEVALDMLQGLLDPAKWEVEVSPIERLTSEVVAAAGESRPAVIVIGSLPPGGLAHTRYLCKRITQQFPEARVAVGRWGAVEQAEDNRAQLAEVGAVYVATSLADMIQHLRGWRSALRAQQKPADGEPVGQSGGKRAVGTSSA
ncbi:MAG TPA: AI-2E family transporter [Fimbriiglobus sp.]|nr:AI-2E family transporter [Fimbriiglobus sp.]